MIDLRLLRNDPGFVMESWKRRGADVDADALVELESRHRQLMAEVERMRADHNVANKRIAKTAAGGRQAAIDAAKQAGERLSRLEQELKVLRDELDRQMEVVPNLVHPQAPEGQGDAANRLVRQVGEIQELDFEGRDHLDLGVSLGIIDVDRAAKVSGSRFAFLKGDGAFLALALVRFALELLADKGFIPIIPPVLVREKAMQGTGFFPTDEAQVYKTASDDLYLAGTSEVPIASMHSDEILATEQLPLRYAGFSTCFRREAGTYGKDTRGIIRVHQFEKVEMFSFCSPEASNDEHMKLLSLEEEIFKALEIPYRLIEICAGDLAAPNYRKFDLEAWLPGTHRWLEVTSCSNDIDYQARRLGIRTRNPKGTEPVHTLNGTAVAVQRAVVALLENHQQPDGSIKLPAALTPYTGFQVISVP